MIPRNTETIPLHAVAEEVKKRATTYLTGFGLVENQDFRVNAVVNGQVHLTVELNGGHIVGSYLPSFQQQDFLRGKNNIHLEMKNATVYTRPKAVKLATKGKGRR